MPEELGFQPVFGYAPRLIVTNGLVLPALRPCIARASNSFPVPVSPWMRAVELASAALAALSNTASSPFERPREFQTRGFVSVCERRSPPFALWAGRGSGAFSIPAPMPPERFSPDRDRSAGLRHPPAGASSSTAAGPHVCGS